MAVFGSSTEAEKSFVPLLVGLALASAALGTAAIDARVFQLFVMAIAFLAARELAWMMNGPKPVISTTPAAFSAVLFPAISGSLGERTALAGSAIVVLCLGVFFVARGLRREIVLAYATTVFVGLYAGLLSSYLVLLRQSRFGLELIGALVMMLAGYRFGKWVGRSLLSSTMTEDSRISPNLWGPFLGVLSSAIAALASLFFLPGEAGVVPVVALAIIVGLTSITADYVSSMLRANAGLGLRASSLPGQGGLILSIHSVLLVAPAFYFGFKLYLT